MTSTSSTVSTAEPGAPGAIGKRPASDRSVPSRRARAMPRAGWMVIAGGKEFGDHVLSSRFLVLAIVMAIAAAVPLYFISGQMREAPSGATDFPALFIALFWRDTVGERWSAALDGGLPLQARRSAARPGLLVRCHQR